MLTDEEIKKLYTDKNFNGSFSGVRNLKLFLKTDYNEDVSSSRFYKILKEIPNYIYHLRPIRKFPTRSYQVDSFGKLCECDLAFMAKFNGFIGFLVFVDVFSQHLWCEPFRKKSAASTQKLLAKILDSIDSPITEIASDSGGEFVGNRAFFEERHILFTRKTGKNKVVTLISTVVNLNYNYKLF